LTLLRFGKITRRIGDPSGQGRLPVVGHQWQDEELEGSEVWTDTHALFTHKSRLRFAAKEVAEQP